MRPAPFLRCASVTNLLFAAGHTIGFLSFQPASAEGRTAVRAMSAVFEEGGTRFSYAGFYKGFGLSCTLAMLLVSIWCWWLGELAKSAPRTIVPPVAALTLYGCGGLILASLYFPLPAVIFSAILPLLYGLALIAAVRARGLIRDVIPGT